MANFDHLAARLAELDQQRRLRRLVPRAAEGVYVIDRDGRRLLNFGGNDYLGLAAEPTALAAGPEPTALAAGPEPTALAAGPEPTALAAGPEVDASQSERPEASAFGSKDEAFASAQLKSQRLATGSMASPLVCGWTEQHQALAETIADFESTESAVLFPSGYAACSGTIATLAGQGDLILSDEFNHASLIDGCRLSRAARIIYPHRDCETVQSVLRQRRDEFARVWIVTDAVFSMDGHVAPLTELSDLAEQFDACLLVDEAHATGVLGDTGSGACEALGVKDRAQVRIGTLSKAIGSQGGFVAGPTVVIDYLINSCRSLIFSTSLAPAAVRAAIDGFEAISRQPERRARVGQLARRFRASLSIDSDPIESSVPIISWVVGADERAVAASEQLAESGFYVPAIRPPSVKEGTARLRISLSAAHDEEMVDSLAKAILELG